MSESIPHEDQNKTEANEVKDLAAKEKSAAKRMPLGNQLYTLVAALLFYVFSLVLPHAGPARGYDVLFQTSVAADAGIKITEFIYSILLFLGIGILTSLTMLTRRAVFGILAWMVTTVGFAYSLFAIWLRQTRSSATDGVEFGVGMWVSLIAVALAFVAFSTVSLRRDDTQAHLAQARAETDNLDEVGQAQRLARVERENTTEDNPSIEDDRRRRALERHHRPTES